MAARMRFGVINGWVGFPLKYWCLRLLLMSKQCLDLVGDMGS
jgi:hypothetical protein